MKHKQSQQQAKYRWQCYPIVRGAIAATLAAGTVFCVNLSAFALTNNLDQQLQIPLNNGTQGSIRDEADRLARLGMRQEESGQLEKAIESWYKALELYHRIGDLEAQGIVYEQIGMAYGELSMFVEAEDALRRRLGIARDIKDFRGQIYGLNNVGTILLKRGDLNNAADAFAEGLEVSRSIKSAEGIGLSSSNLGLVAAASGEHLKAIKHYRVALPYRGRASDPIGEANTWNNLGDSYRAVKDYDEAASAYGAALRLARQSDSTPDRLRAIDGLVPAHSTAVGRYGYAFELMDERFQLAQEMSSGPQQLTTLQSIAELYEEIGNEQAARNFYWRAIAVARQIDDTRTEIELLSRISRMGFFEEELEGTN